MIRFKLFIMFGFSLMAPILIGGSVFAAGQSIVISQLQISDVTKNHFVELYNNSRDQIDVTGWCLYHSSASDKTFNELACLNDLSNQNTHLVMPGQSYLLLGANGTKTEEPPMSFDVNLTSSLGGVTGGHIYLTDSNRSNDNATKIDRVGWGTAINPEAQASILSAGGSVLVRNIDQNSGMYIDTDNNLLDFSSLAAPILHPIGTLIEINDACPNLTDIQLNVPDGYALDAVGNCQLINIDVCPNLDGEQALLPENYYRDEAGNCIENEPEVVGGGNEAEVSNAPKLSELLPDPEGTDSGNEFIELYNPYESPIQLEGYSLRIENSQTKTYNLPDVTIAPSEYLAIFNNEINFTLVNTSSVVSVVDETGVVLDHTSYSEPVSGESWSLINGTWQYTNQITPGARNLKFIVDSGEVEGIESSDEVTSCQVGYYRNPSTNRCKKIETTINILQPCADGYYRNPETNRCKKITSTASTSAACADGYYRNPTTNRCKKIDGSSSTLKPCADGYERNPETNRCRKAQNSEVLSAEYAPENTKSNSANPVLWWSLGGVGLAVASYGVWEWREEIKKLWQKIKGLRHR